MKPEEKTITEKKDWDIINEHEKDIEINTQISWLLGWDQRVNLPKNGSEARGEHQAFLKRILHEKITSQELEKAIKNVQKTSLNQKEKRKIELLTNKIKKTTILPEELQERIMKQSGRTYGKWEIAKEEKNYEIVRKELEELINLNKQATKIYNFQGHPLNSLIDYFEEGMTVEKLTEEFKTLKEGIIKLLEKIKSSEEYNKKITLKNTPKKEKTAVVINDAIKRMKLEEGSYRTDETTHPFSGSYGEGDARLAISYKKPPIASFLAAMHEAGHVMYELGLPKKEKFSLIGKFASFGLHESQSKLWETMIGRSKPFWKHYAKKFNELYEQELSAEEWYKLVNQVWPNPGRISSDELHYALHIIIRFELEQELMSGQLKAENLKDAWNEKMKNTIGTTPKNDEEGVLQDAQWYSGSFGYFPTYNLGSIYALQFYNKMLEENNNVEQEIEEGNFSTVKEWVRKNVHSKGSELLAEEIVKQATGSGIDAKTYLEYLNKKYSEIYNL